MGLVINKFNSKPSKNKTATTLCKMRLLPKTRSKAPGATTRAPLILLAALLCSSLSVSLFGEGVRADETTTRVAVCPRGFFQTSAGNCESKYLFKFIPLQKHAFFIYPTLSPPFPFKKPFQSLFTI